MITQEVVQEFCNDILKELDGLTSLVTNHSILVLIGIAIHIQEF